MTEPLRQTTTKPALSTKPATNTKPAPGTKPGDNVEFGGLLGHAPVIPLNRFGSAEFIQRGGRIPAPLHSLKN